MNQPLLAPEMVRNVQRALRGVRQHYTYAEVRRRRLLARTIDGWWHFRDGTVSHSVGHEVFWYEPSDAAVPRSGWLEVK
jgi:hypothetical protein